MKPLGRKTVQFPNAKHHPKENGRNVPGWWEDVACPSKKRERRNIKQEIQNEIQRVDSEHD
jgi:hypothetical protein